MKKVIAIAEILALSITPTVSFADHLEPKESEIRPGGNFAHTNLFRASLSGADLTFTNLKGANLSGANLSGTNPRGFEAKNLTGCPTNLPNNLICRNRQIQFP